MSWESEANPMSLSPPSAAMDGHELQENTPGSDTPTVQWTLRGLKEVFEGRSVNTVDQNPQ